MDVEGDGIGHGRSLSHQDALFVHQLRLSTVSPSWGSLGGGTELTLRGDGFSSDLAELVVKVGDVPCRVTHAHAEELVCVTSPRAATEDPSYSLYNRSVSDDDVLPTAVTVHTRGMLAPCDGNCEFTYHVDHTPLIDPSCLSSSLLGDGTWILSLCGSGFSTPPRNNNIWIGGATGSACSPETGGNATHLTCRAGPLTAGIYEVRLQTALGFAVSAAPGIEPTFEAPLIVNRSAPTVTVITGGVTVSIHGTGFAQRPEANNVSICGKSCEVTVASATKLECIAPSMLPYDWDGEVRHVNSTVATSTDLAVQPASSTTPAPTGATINLQNRAIMAIAFRGFRMPQFSEPMQALLRVPALSSSGNIRLSIDAALSGCGSTATQSANPFTSDLRTAFSDRTAHNSSVIWEPLPWSGAQDEESPDISTLIGEIASFPNWRDDGSCVVVLLVSHLDGDGTRSLTGAIGSAGTASPPTLSVSYVLPSPFAQLGSVQSQTIPCTIRLDVQSHSVSPLSEVLGLVGGIASAENPTPSSGRRLNTLQSCAANDAQFVDNVLIRRSVSIPPPLVVEIEAQPSIGPEWATCSVSRDGTAVISGTPVEPTVPAGGICAVSYAPDTLIATAHGCWKTHLSGYQVELFGLFVRDLPNGHLIVLVTCGVPWYKSENFDQFYLPSRVDELYGILTTIGFRGPREQMASMRSMVGVKAGMPRIEPSDKAIILRATPAFEKTSRTASWHIEQKWRADNLQPHPSLFAPDRGLALIKKLDAALDEWTGGLLKDVVPTLQRGVQVVHNVTAKFADSAYEYEASARSWPQEVRVGYSADVHRVPRGGIERCSAWDHDGSCSGYTSWRGQTRAYVYKSYYRAATREMYGDLASDYAQGSYSSTNCLANPPPSSTRCWVVLPETLDGWYWRHTSDWSRRYSGQWYLDPDYEPLSWAGNFTPYLSAAQAIRKHAAPLLEAGRYLTSSPGSELRLAAAAAANAVAARAVDKQPVAHGTISCDAVRTTIMEDKLYSPHCKQARLERALRDVDAKAMLLHEQVEHAIPRMTFDNEWQLRCWKLDGAPNDAVDPATLGKPHAIELVGGINFQHSMQEQLHEKRLMSCSLSSQSCSLDTGTTDTITTRTTISDPVATVGGVPAYPPWVIGGVEFRDNFFCQATTAFKPNVTGTATFYSESDDGHILYIDGTQVLYNGGTHNPKLVKADVHLEAGITYRLESTYFQVDQGKTWKLYWHPPDDPRCKTTSAEGTKCETPIGARLFTAPKEFTWTNNARHELAWRTARTLGSQLDTTLGELIAAIEETKAATRELITDAQEALFETMGSPEHIATIASLHNPISTQELTDGVDDTFVLTSSHDAVMLAMSLDTPHVLRSLHIRWKAPARQLLALLSPSIDGEADWYIGAKVILPNATESVVELGGLVARRIRLVAADGYEWRWDYHGPLLGIREIRLSGCVTERRAEWGQPGSPIEGLRYTLDLPRPVPHIYSIGQTRGSTLGGTRVLIEGWGFDHADNVTVRIAGVPATVLWVHGPKDEANVSTLWGYPHGSNGTNLTRVMIATGSHGATSASAPGLGLIELTIEGIGIAAATAEAAYQYVDLWSRYSSWGGNPPCVYGITPSLCLDASL